MYYHSLACTSLRPFREDDDAHAVAVDDGEDYKTNWLIGR